MILSGTDNYTGGTVVSAGKLIISAPTALPRGGSLSVGVGASSLFGASPGAANLPVEGLAATAVPITMNVALPSQVLPGPNAAEVLTSGKVAAPGSASVVNTTEGSQIESCVSGETQPVAWGPMALLRSDGTNSLSKSVCSGISGIPAAKGLIRTSTAKRIAGGLDWLEQTASSSDNSDQQRKKDVAILALDAVFAQYGQ